MSFFVSSLRHGQDSYTFSSDKIDPMANFGPDPPWPRDVPLIVVRRHVLSNSYQLPEPLRCVQPLYLALRNPDVTCTVRIDDMNQ